MADIKDKTTKPPRSVGCSDLSGPSAMGMTSRVGHDGGGSNDQQECMMLTCHRRGPRPSTLGQWSP